MHTPCTAGLGDTDPRPRQQPAPGTRVVTRSPTPAADTEPLTHLHEGETQIATAQQWHLVTKEQPGREAGRG